MHTILSNLAHRQTDKQTWACGRKHYTSSVVGDNKCLSSSLTGTVLTLFRVCVHYSGVTHLHSRPISKLFTAYYVGAAWVNCYYEM